MGCNSTRRPCPVHPDSAVFTAARLSGMLLVQRTQMGQFLGNPDLQAARNGLIDLGLTYGPVFMEWISVMLLEYKHTRRSNPIKPVEQLSAGMIAEMEIEIFMPRGFQLMESYLIHHLHQLQPLLQHRRTLQPTHHLQLRRKLIHLCLQLRKGL